MKPLSRTGTLAVSWTLFFGLGLLVAALGPAIADLATRTGSTVVEAGGVLTALFCGGFAAQLAIGALSERIGQRALLFAGALCYGGGMLGMALSPALPLTLACGVVTGLGHGTLVVVMHVLIAQLFPERSVSALNLLNVFFGVGATLGPVVARQALQEWGSALPALWIGAGLMFIQLPFIPLLATRPDVAAHADGGAQGGAPRARVYGLPALWLFGLMLFLYVGAESGVGSWATRYLERSTAIKPADAAFVASGFWLALTVGRMLGAALGTRLSSAALLQLCLGGAALGGVVFALSPGNLALSSAAILLLGVCFGPVFPTTLALVSATFPQAQGVATSAIVAMGNGGGIVLPWLIGLLLERAGPPASALLVMVATLSMAAIFTAYRLRRRGAPEAAREPIAS
ncbi:MAG TPA: MFS transporter [Herpetosiphonaceae bacterium]